jgi:adenine phosphoribosyltransferase
MNIEEVKKSIRNVADFPKEGIQFKDITTALKNAEILKYLSDELFEIYKDKGITKVVGIESRGFILGSILAYKLGAGMVLMRKPGKLPSITHAIDYELEYGTNSLEIHTDALDENDIVLLHDDLLATGGSAKAAIDLIELFKPKKIYSDFLIELEFLNGREKLKDYSDIHTLIKF